MSSSTYKPRKPSITSDDQWIVLAVLATRHPTTSISKLRNVMVIASRNLNASKVRVGMSKAALRMLLLSETDDRLRGVHP